MSWTCPNCSVTLKHPGGHVASCGTGEQERRFWAKVDKGPHPKGCWLYTGFRKWDGYGWLQRYIGGKAKSLTAHRYAWLLTHGEPPQGMHLMHTCDVPACCNPAHLRLGTHQENMADMRAKGRAKHQHRGTLHPERVRPRRQAA